MRDFRPNGRHAQTLGDPVQRYASLSQLSGIGFESVARSSRPSQEEDEVGCLLPCLRCPLKTGSTWALLGL